MKLQKYILSSLFSGLFIVACSKKSDVVDHQQTINSTDQNNNVTQAKQDSLKKDSIEKASIKYDVFIFPEGKKEKDSAMSVFNEKFSEEEQYKILAINRLDTKNKWRADTLAVPEKLDLDFIKFSPFPSRLAVLKNVHKMVIFSYPIQAFAYYENGDLKRWGPTSLGKKSSPTKTGLTYTNWKKKEAISTVDSDWKLPFNVNIYNHLGIGWHQYDLPGYPASHSCLRLLEDDAKFLYEIADTWKLSNNGQKIEVYGTPVLVYGDFDWNGQKPWYQLIADSNATSVDAEMLEQLIKPELPDILEKQNVRAEVGNL